MPIAVDIDVMLAKRKMPVRELAERVGITPANLAVLKNGRAKGRCCVAEGRAGSTPRRPAQIASASSVKIASSRRPSSASSPSS